MSLLYQGCNSKDNQQYGFLTIFNSCNCDELTASVLLQRKNTTYLERENKKTK